MTKNSEKRKGLVLKRWTVLVVIGMFAAIVFVVYCCSVQSKINAKQAELAELRAECTEICEENEELRDRKAKGKDPDNMERIARENYDYVYPDEKVYVISP